MHKKTRKKILKEHELILKMMSYKIGKPTSEQLNEWSYIENAYDTTVDAVSDAVETVGDGLEYIADKSVEIAGDVADAVEDGYDEIVDYAKGNQGAVPDFIPLIGTKKKAEDAVKIAIAAGVTLLSPTLPLLVKYICGTDLLPGLQKLYKGYTKVPDQELDEILKHDLWWDAEKCLEYGLVDKILD